MLEKASPQPGKAPEKQPSPAFEKLISDRSRLRRLLKESDVTTPPFDSREQMWEWWKKGRKPIADLIDELVGVTSRPVSLLDFGSANAFLDLCIREWCTNDIDPYGFDKEAGRIRQAQKLFPEIKDHFTSDRTEFQRMPDVFDYVYWNVWDSHSFNTAAGRTLLHELRGRVRAGGKLILGFYDHAKKNREAKIAQLAACGLSPEGVRQGPNETFVWLSGSNETP